MNDPKIFYPDFLPNQILTNTQLNDLRNYLDVQNLKTRMRFVGAGIVCGFNFNFNQALKEISLCNGYGLTSAGHLIELPIDKSLIKPKEKIFTKKATYIDPDQDDNGNPNYKLWRAPEAGHNQIELFELKEDGDDGVALQDSDFEGKVLLLYLQKKGVDLNSCLVTECDNKGVNINLEVKVLLVPENYFSEMDTGIKPVLKSFKIPRLHTELNFSDVDASEKINLAYARIIQLYKNALANKIKTLLDDNPLCREIGNYEALITKYKSDIDALISAKAINQYHYDHLNDLADAYNELVLALLKYKQNCFEEGDYPRHLILGLSNGTHLCRHHFKPAPVMNVIEHEQKYIKRLVLRVLLIMDKFKLPTSSPINITPSNTPLHPLGHRAIPYYYDDPGLNAAKFWKPFDRYEFDEQWAYSQHDASRAGNDFRNDYSNSSFIRIEGHLGKNCKTVANNLEQLKKRHNVEFDVLVTHLNKPPVNQAVMDDLHQAQAALTKLYSGLRKGINELIKQPKKEGKIVTEIQKIRTQATAYQNLIYENNKKWAEQNCAVVTQCNLTELQSQYLEYRAELIAILSRFQSRVASFSTGDRLLPTIIFDKKKKAKTNFQINANPLRRSLVFIANVLLERIKNILKTFFVKDICEFNYEIFIHEYKEIYADFMAFNLLHGEYLRLSRKNIAINIPPSLDEGIPDYLFGHASVVIDKLGALFVLYEKYRSVYGHVLFKNFANYVTGLEHLAGVQRCGTFVLVCDDENNIVADFSLACQLACCCDVNMSSLCLPVIATTDYTIARIAEGANGYKPVTAVFNLLKNDYDTNWDSSLDLIVPLDEQPPAGKFEKENAPENVEKQGEKITKKKRAKSTAALKELLLEERAAVLFESDNSAKFFQENSQKNPQKRNQENTQNNRLRKLPILSAKVSEDAKTFLLKNDVAAIKEFEILQFGNTEKKPAAEKPATRKETSPFIIIDIPDRQLFPNRKKLSITYLDEKTELGGTIEPLEASPGYVRYYHPEPQPYLVDRFRYEITWEEPGCVQTDNAYGLIFHWPTEVGEGRITGTVFILKDDERIPLENAAVVNVNNDTVLETTATGEFQFAGLQPDIYTLRVFKQGYQKETRVVEVDTGETEKIEIELLPLTLGGIKGLVVERPESGQPVPMEEAIVSMFDGNVEKTILTPADGTFFFSDLQPAKYNLKVGKEDYNSEERSIELRNNELQEIEIELKLKPVKSFKITGFVQLVRTIGRDRPPRDVIEPLPYINIVPLPGAEVVLNETEARVLTDKDGRFEFSVSAPGTYTLRVTSPISNVSKSVTVEVSNGDPEALFIRFFGSDFELPIPTPTPTPIPLPPVPSPTPIIIPDKDLPVLNDFLGVIDPTPAADLTVNINTGLTAEGEVTKAIRDTLNNGEVKLVATDIADKNPNLVAVVEEFAEVARVDADTDTSNIDATYEAVAENLKEAINTAPEEDKATYGKLLETTSKIYLDSLATRNTSEVTPQTEAAVKKVVNNVSDANLDLAKFKQDWNGEKLATDGNVPSAKAISNLIP